MNDTETNGKSEARVGLKTNNRPRCKYTSGDNEWHCSLHAFGKSEYCVFHSIEAEETEEQRAERLERIRKRKAGIPLSWRVEVVADNTGEWNGNALRFKTEEEAWAWGIDLSRRWTLVRQVRVVGDFSEGPNR